MYFLAALITVFSGIPLPKALANEPTVEVLESTVNPQTGDEEPTVVLVKDKDTGNQTVVGLDSDPKVAKIRALLAFRLKFPELFGFRFGVNIDNTVDAGLEIGSGLFFSSAGVFVNYYPAGKSRSSIRNLYLGGRIQKELIFGIFASASGTREEGVVGYKFDKNPGGFHSFLEAGGGRQIGPLHNSGSTDTHPSDPNYKSYAYPIVTIGFGWTIPK